VAQILVRGLDDDVKARLGARAQRHGHSTEQEVREILQSVVSGEEPGPMALGSRIAARFSELGLEHKIPELRGQPPRPASFAR
jgi:plasmid stability protein